MGTISKNPPLLPAVTWSAWGFIIFWALFDSLLVHAVIFFLNSAWLSLHPHSSLCCSTSLSPSSLSNISYICSFTAHSLVSCLCPLSLIGLPSSCGHCSLTQPSEPATNFHSDALIFHPFLCLFSFCLLICSFLIAQFVFWMKELMLQETSHNLCVNNLIIVLEDTFILQVYFSILFSTGTWENVTFKPIQLAQRGITIIWLGTIFNRDAK